MIKLIASDLDGTLLQHGSQQVSSEIIELIHKLHAKGILFVAASGRQYPNLRRLFAPVADEIGFICSNGSLMMCEGKELCHTPIDRELGMQIIEDIYSREELDVLIDGKFTSYIKPKTSEYEYQLKEVVKNNMTVISDFSEIKEDFLKISVFEAAGLSEETKAHFSTEYEGRAVSAVSGREWLDFTAPMVNKGTAINHFMEKLCMKPENTMAFGDNFNDIQMLQAVGVGYIMETAHEDVKKVTPYRCSRVEDTIRELLESGRL